MLEHATALDVQHGARGPSVADTGALPVSDLDVRLSRLGRGERLITWSRVALSLFSLAAVWLDPAEPAHWATVAYSILVAFVLYALVLALVVSKAAAPMPHFGAVTHSIDLAIAIAVNAFTGPGSPFFVLFVFLLVAATLRWQWRGVAWTGAAALIAHLLFGFFGLEGMGEAGFELNRFIVRGAYLVVVAVLLGFLGTWEERLRSDLVDLADFPRHTGPSFGEAARDSLAYAAAILRSPRLLLAWDDTEEPWHHTLWWERGELCEERHRADALTPLVAEELQAAVFVCLDLTAETPTTVRTQGEGLAVWRGAPIHQELLRRTGAENVLSVPVAGEGVDAHLFAFDKPSPNTDDLVVGLILGRQIVAALEQAVLIRETQLSAAGKERLRLAREIHDGVAQSLTAASLHIGGLRRLAATDPDAMPDRIDQIARMLVNEQRELRLFLQELRPSTTASDAANLGARLRELGHRVASLWEVEVELEVSDEVATPLGWEVFRLVQEGMVNAARHAHASRIEVTVASEPSEIRLRIADDGQGFPFHGVFDLAALTAQRIGPLSLKERVASLRGELELASSDRGTVLDIVLPRRAHEGTA